MSARTSITENFSPNLKGSSAEFSLRFVGDILT